MNLVTVRTYKGVTTRLLVANDDNAVNLAAFCLRLDSVGYIALDRTDLDLVSLGEDMGAEELERSNDILRCFHFNTECEL